MIIRKVLNIDRTEIKLTKLFRDFIRSESSSGIILIVITFLSLIFSNFIFHERFTEFWKTTLLEKPLDFWINDILMTFFFLLVGFEIEREVYVGELSEPKKALLPIVAAIGGMIVPAMIFISLNINSGFIGGFGIPTATDIAFSLTILTILSSRIPSSLKVFLTALAIIDDIGAIIIISIFYTKNFSLVYFLFACVVFFVLWYFNRKGFKNLFLYFIPGVLLWFLIYKSGIHPTITGVLLAFIIPFGNGDKSSPSYKVEKKLHKPVAFIVLPFFAIANTGILIHTSDFSELFSASSLGIISGLVIGKPLGITLFCWSAIKLRFCSLFKNLSMKHIFGAGLIAGIGFTMSIFITLLAYNDLHLIKISKLAIIISSLLSASLGIIYIRLTTKKLTFV